MSVCDTSQPTPSGSSTGAYGGSIHTLPTELLREIFTLVVADQQKPINITSKGHSGLVNTDIHPTLALSQTCHRWRGITQDMPRLWTAVHNIAIGSENTPTQVNRHLFALYLARAKQLPLSVLLLSDTRAASKLVPHMHRVRSLELVDFSDSCRLDLLEHPAPALEYFLLSTPPRSSIFNPRPSMHQRPAFFAGHAPSLRALALLSPSFLPRQPFPALTDLHIGSTSKPHLQDLLELLRGAPALESLAIVDLRIPVGLWPFGAPQQPPPAQPGVALPRLRRLALVQTPFARGFALLAEIAVPPDAELHLLELFADRHIDPSPLPHLAPVAAATALEMVVCGRTLSFRTRGPTSTSSSSSRSSSSSSSRVTPTPRVRCTARWGAHAYSWWRGLWQTLPCALLTDLRIAVDADDDELLPRFLDAAIVLVTLEPRLQPQPQPRGENVLAHRQADGAPQALLGVCALLEQELPVVCPCLEELAIIDASSTAGAWDGFLSGGDASLRVAYVPDMLCVVAARAAAGRGLRRVALQGQWRSAQRDRVRGAFAMGAAVTEFEFRELDTESSPLFEFEDDEGEEAWVNEHWMHELPKRTLPWAPR